MSADYSWYPTFLIRHAALFQRLTAILSEVGWLSNNQNSTLFQCAESQRRTPNIWKRKVETMLIVFFKFWFRVFVSLQNFSLKGCILLRTLDLFLVCQSYYILIIRTNRYIFPGPQSFGIWDRIGLSSIPRGSRTKQLNCTVPWLHSRYRLVVSFCQKNSSTTKLNYTLGYSLRKESKRKS